MDDPEQLVLKKVGCMSCRIVRIATMTCLSAYTLANYYALPKASVGRPPLLIISVCAGGWAG